MRLVVFWLLKLRNSTRNGYVRLQCRYSDEVCSFVLMSRFSDDLVAWINNDTEVTGEFIPEHIHSLLAKILIFCLTKCMHMHR